jgi:hypothetical protein
MLVMHIDQISKNREFCFEQKNNRFDGKTLVSGYNKF